MKKERSKRKRTEPRLQALASMTPEMEGGAVNRGMFIASERLSSERYQAFFESIQEGLYEADIDGNFLYFNDPLCEVFGYPREEIIFQNFSRFMHTDDTRKTLNTFKRIYRSGRGVTDFVCRIIDKRGEVKVIELSANLITNQDGEKIGFRGIARDITEKLETQEAFRKSERRYKILLDFVPYPIVVFTLDGRVSYLNPAFTEVFGWTFKELEGKNIPYVPPGLEKETAENIKRLLRERVILRYETKRLTKDGRILDVVMSGAVYAESGDEPAGELVILEDITQEKRIARSNEAMQRISVALPEYPDLEKLLDYISNEVKRLLVVEGALVLLLDEEKNELFFKAAAHDDSAAEKRVKEVRFPAERGVSGRVIKTGQSVIVTDVTKDPDFYSVVDTQAGFTTHSLLDAPLRSKDRIIGVLCASNKKVGTFDKTDVELLNMIASTVALSVENARFSEEIKEAYQEVRSLNRAKDKVINHLSHELKTPLAVLSASLNIISKRLSSVPSETWMPTISRAHRNLDRILEMQYQVEDIMRGGEYESHHLITRLLDACTDELESLVAEEVGEGTVVERIRRRIDEDFGPKRSKSREIYLDQFVSRTIEDIRPFFPERQLDLVTRFESVPQVMIPEDPLKKVVVGLIKNAIENTPDEGKIEIFISGKGKGAEFLVRDYGVGIISENQRRIFEGFFATQETMDYSSKRPYDFNAGGKGADLMRMKIFSERYGFKINMDSSRCRYIPLDKDICPGRISKCSFCKSKEDCYRSGGTTFTVFFSPADDGEMDERDTVEIV